MVNNSVASAMDLSVSQHLSHAFTVSKVSCKILPIFNDSTNFQNAGLILDCSLQIQTLIPLYRGSLQITNVKGK